VAEFACFPVTESRRVLGAFQRSAPGGVGRRSGGPPLFARGGIYFALALSRHDELVPCDPNQTINRYVRPLLRALTSLGKPASYFGRDWISVAGHPAASIGCAHHAQSGATHVESFIALSAPFAEPRHSFRGKAPSFLNAVYQRELEAERVVAAIQNAYDSEYGSRIATAPMIPWGKELRDLPPWAHTIEDAIGEVGAVKDGSGKVRIGGEWMASEDAVARFENELNAMRDAGELSRAEVEALAHRVFNDARVMLFGATAHSIAEVAHAALISVPSS